MPSPFSYIYFILVVNLCMCHVWWNLWIETYDMTWLLCISCTWLKSRFLKFSTPKPKSRFECIMESTHEILIQNWSFEKGLLKPMLLRIMKNRKPPNISYNYKFQFQLVKTELESSLIFRTNTRINIGIIFFKGIYLCEPEPKLENRFLN